MRGGIHMIGKISIRMMVMLLFLLPLMNAISVYGQPLGFGASKPKPSQQSILSSEEGRFVFGQISASNKDQFMLDTTTGRLWRIGESGKVGIFLKSVPYLSSDGECSPLPDKIPGSGPKTSEKK